MANKRTERELAFYIGKKTGDWTRYDEIIKKDRQVFRPYADKIVLSGEHN